MGRKQGTGRRMAVIMLATITLLLAYSTLLTLHYRIPDKLMDRLRGDSPDSVGPSARQATESRLLAREARKRADVIMLGDSITQGAQWNEYFPDVTVFNRGIGGDTTAGVTARLDDVIRERPDHIFLMIGINDILAGRAAEAVARDIMDIAGKIRDSGITPHVQSILYTERRYRHLSPTSAEVNARIRAANDRLRALCQREDVSYLDVNRALADAEGFLRPGHSLDGLHPNARGYALWVAELRRTMSTPPRSRPEAAPQP